MNYGANAACAKLGVQGVADLIETFDASSYDDPISAFYDTLGIEKREDLEATKNREKENLDPSVSSQKISRENFVQAISDFKKLVVEIKSDPRFAELNDTARSYGTTAFDKASQISAEEGGQADFVGAMKVLQAQRVIAEKAEEKGISKDEAIARALGEEPEEQTNEVPEPFENPEGDKLIEATALLKQKIAEAEQFLFQNKNSISDEDQEKIQDTISNSKITLENPTKKADDRLRASEELDNIIANSLKAPNQE